MAASETLAPTEEITRAILVLRGHRVLLDSELAGFYGVSTKALNQAVKRNAIAFRTISCSGSPEPKPRL